MDTGNILFKFTTIRNAKKGAAVEMLIKDNNESSILAAITANKTPKELQDEISEVIERIGAVVGNYEFQNITYGYDILKNEVAQTNKTVLSSDFVKNVFGVESNWDHKRLLYARNDYANMLFAIKLWSNRTKETHKEAFIKLLKAWSMLTMYESAQEYDTVKWIDVFSGTFVIPSIKDIWPHIDIRDSQRMNTNDEFRKDYETLRTKYKGLRDSLSQLNEMIDDLKAIERYANFNEEEMEDIGVLKDLTDSKLFAPVFKSVKSQQPKLTRVSTRKVALKNIGTRIAAIIDSKSKGLKDNLQIIAPELVVTEDEIKSGNGLNKVLAEKVRLEGKADQLEILAKNKFSVDLNSNNIPSLIPNLEKPNDWIISSAGRLPTHEEPLLKLLVSDLILVEEKNVGYVASSIAHIETAMQGESRSRTHRTLDRIERRLTTSESTQVKQSLNLATSSNSNFQSEIEKAQKQKLGGEVETGYKGTGFHVDVTAYYDDEKEKSDHAVRKTAEDITEEARIEVTRKIEQERAEISINEVEIINEHKLENNSEGHINGIYQWVDQVKEFRTLSYGRHLMAKVILPDPAKLLFSQKKEADMMQPLEEFPLNSPTEITHHQIALNVGEKYGVTDFDTPPPRTRYITKTIEFNEKNTESLSAGYLLNKDSIIIPSDDKYKGYKVDDVFVQYRCPWKNPTGGDRRQLNIDVLEAHYGVDSTQGGDDTDEYPSFWFDTVITNGYRRTTHGGGLNAAVLANGHNKSHTAGMIHYVFIGAQTVGLEEIPITVMTRNNNYFQATVIVKLSAENGYEGHAHYQWQKDVYDKLYQAYLQKKDEYKRSERSDKEDKMLGVISGQNPEKNKQVIHEELKRQVITILRNNANQTFEGFFSSTQEDYEIQIDQMKMFSKYIDFFENAIDWKKMSYRLFPYYWHQYENWKERQLFKDSDPHYEAFMRSGAVETIIPIKRGYERQFMHYMENGGLWNHNEPLSITYDDDPDLVAEINEFIDEEAPGVKQVDSPWRARIPTNLIILSDKNNLEAVPPINTNQNDGENS